MRLLVTNTQSAQAYSVIRSLRPHAETIVATVAANRSWSWASCQAAYSRLVDRRYPILTPDLDWRAGRIQPENTEAEAAFVAAILDICARERIDTIFPTADAWVYVLSKNKRRFAERGIVLPVPDYETVLTPLDKYRTIQHAREVGFPCPRTHLAESDDAVARVAEELGPPWVIKPRFTTGSSGLAIVERPAELIEKSRAIRKSRGAPMIQEYVPGRTRQNFYMVVDQEGNALSVFAPRVVRYTRRVFRTSTAACETSDPPAFAEEVVRLVRRIGWWGGLTVQTKIDPRDGTPKLMEINPRLGSNLWHRTELGINEPLMCVKIARGEEVGPVPAYPRGYMLLQPIDDAVGLVFELTDLAIYRLRVGLFRRPALDASNPPMSLRELIGLYRDQYGGTRPKRFSPQFRYGLSDPLPMILFSCAVLVSYGRAATSELGR
jgi:biotin carboxylase